MLPLLLLFLRSGPTRLRRSCPSPVVAVADMYVGIGVNVRMGDGAHTSGGAAGGGSDGGGNGGKTR